MNSTPTRTPLIVGLTKHLPLVEKVLMMALAIGIILTITGIDSTITKTALLGLAVTFFLMAYRPVESLRQENEQLGFPQLLAIMIVPKVLWISSAVSAIGIAFYLFGNEGYKQQAIIGGLSIAIGTLIFVISLVTEVKHIKTVTPILLRALPLLLADFYIFFFK